MSNFGIAPVEEAVPGWEITFCGRVLETIDFNSFSLGGAAVWIDDQILPGTSGSYYLFMVSSACGGLDNSAQPMTVSQTGPVPSDAASISFFARNRPALAGRISLELSGVTIPLIDLGGRVGGDVSAFAGQVVELKISVVATDALNGIVTLDDIQFSSVPLPDAPVPELQIVLTDLDDEPVVEISFDTQKDSHYQLLQVPDFPLSFNWLGWIADGAAVPGDGERLSLKRKLSGDARRYYRVMAIPPYDWENGKE
jgi:hypothetical protein